MNLLLKQTTVSPSIYKLAEEFADDVRALAIIESGETVIQVGDSGQAFGLLQMHPAFVKDYSRWTNIAPNDTWAQAEVKMTASYFRINEIHGIELLVQGFNLGLHAVLTGKRNLEYLTRWQAALKRIQNPST